MSRRNQWRQYHRPAQPPKLPPANPHPEICEQLRKLLGPIPPRRDLSRPIQNRELYL